MFVAAMLVAATSPVKVSAKTFNHLNVDDPSVKKDPTPGLIPVVLFAVGRHVSLGPSDKKDIIKFKEKIKDYKLEPRFRFKDIIKDIN